MKKQNNMWNPRKEIAIPLAERGWNNQDFERHAKEMGIAIWDSMLSEWIRNIRHPNAKSRDNIRKVFEAHPPEE